VQREVPDLSVDRPAGIEQGIRRNNTWWQLEADDYIVQPD